MKTNSAVAAKPVLQIFAEKSWIAIGAYTVFMTFLGYRLESFRYFSSSRYLQGAFLSVWVAGFAVIIVLAAFLSIKYRIIVVRKEK